MMAHPAPWRLPHLASSHIEESQNFGQEQDSQAESLSNIDDAQSESATKSPKVTEKELFGSPGSLSAEGRSASSQENVIAVQEISFQPAVQEERRWDPLLGPRDVAGIGGQEVTYDEMVELHAAQHWHFDCLSGHSYWESLKVGMGNNHGKHITTPQHVNNNKLALLI